MYGYVQVVDEFGADPRLPQYQADGGACLAGIVGHHPRVLRPCGFQRGRRGPGGVAHGREHLAHLGAFVVFAALGGEGQEELVPGLDRLYGRRQRIFRGLQSDFSGVQRLGSWFASSSPLVIQPLIMERV